MILLTTSWKLIFARERQDEDGAPERTADGGRGAEPPSDCTSSASAEHEPQPSADTSQSERSRYPR